MGKISATKVIFIISFFVITAHLAHAECYNEDACFKDYISQKDTDIVIAVNRDTNQVELYWSQKDNTWLKPDKDYQRDLQKTYDKKLRLKDMQARLDHMHRDSWYNKNESSNSGGSRR